MSTLSIAKQARFAQRERSLGLASQARSRHVTRPAKASSHRAAHAPVSSKGAAAVDLRVQLDAASGAGDEDAALAARDAAREAEDDVKPLPRTVEVSFADLAVGPKRSKQLSGSYEIVPRSTDRAVIAMDEREFAGAVRVVGDSSGQSSSSEDDDGEWELLDLDDEDVGSTPSVAHKKATFASVVGAA
ncbi:hypothetical protein RQP46_004425 [Phenoliferia psychrophenolica]